MSAFMDAVPLCEGGTCRDAICGGTSASTPTVAGIISLINDHRLNGGLPPIGFVNQRLWQVQYSTHYTPYSYTIDSTSHTIHHTHTLSQVARDFPGEAFVDVTEGDTSCKCDSGFGAAKGWDAMTGWGTPKWSGMMKHFGSDAHL
jgi:tripeptidyl-peptidase-1